MDGWIVFSSFATLFSFLYFCTDVKYISETIPFYFYFSFYFLFLPNYLYVCFSFPFSLRRSTLQSLYILTSIKDLD